MSNSPITDPFIGITLSQYEIVAKLGGGGMGVVYQARDRKLGRLVALKFLPSQWSHDEHAKQRFIREAQAASATHHKNICTIHNIEETPDGRLFIVMAYYEGETLKQRLERGPLEPAEALEFTAQIAEGLAKAHAQGVVHRDVKPGNIIVSDDEIKILDFGLAKFADALQLTVPGSTVGTVAYMSPEQVRGADADARSDLWSVGIVLYEMLSGVVPFRGAYPEATFHAIKNEPVPPLQSLRPDLPPGVVSLVMRLLQKQPDLRFQTARELAREVRSLQGRTVPLDLRTEEVPTGALKDRRPAPVVRRRRLVPLLAGVALLAALVAGGSYLWAHRPVERIRVAIVPVANHTGVAELDGYRLALTQALVDELSESPNIRVVPYLRLLEIVRPFVLRGGDVSSSEAVHAVATASGAPFLVVPTLAYQDRDATWLMRVQIRNAETGTTISTYETPAVTSSLSQQTAFRLVATVADSIQAHFKANGPGRAFVQRASSSRLRGPDAARAFEEGLNQYEALEYQQAVAAFTAAATADDQHALTQAWLSRALLIMSRKNDASTAARRAKSLVTAQASPSEVAFVNAVLAESQGEFDTADKEYRALVEIEPDDPFTLTELADFLKRRGDRNQLAIEAYHNVLKADPGYIRPHVDLCQLYTRIDEAPLSLEEATSARDKFRSAGNRGGEAQALLCLGEAKRESGASLNEARSDIAESRRLFESLNQPYGLGRAVFYQALVEYSAYDYPAAAGRFEDASNRTKASGNQVTEALSLMNLGVVNFYSGQPTLALAYYQKGRDAFQRIGDERRAAEMEVNTAGVEIEHGVKLDEARRRLNNARTNLEKLGHVDFVLNARQTEANADRDAGYIERAQIQLRSAIEAARDRQLQSKVVILSVALAQTEMDAGDLASAYGTLRPVVADAEKASGMEPEARLVYGELLARLGDLAAAHQQLDAAMADITRTNSGRLIPAVNLALARLAVAERQGAKARSHFDAAIAAWHDPLPSAAVAEAHCRRPLLDTAPSRTGDGRAEIVAGLKSAEQLDRLSLQTTCRLALAEFDLRRQDPRAALAALNDVADDRDGTMIGRELRIQIDYWRGRALEAIGDPGASTSIAEARRMLDASQQSLPAEFRDRYLQRPELAAVQAPDVRR